MGQDDCSTTTTDQADPESDSGGKQKKPRSKIGDSITLKGTETKMKVKLVKVERDLSAGEFDEPQKGREYIGVYVRVTNVGDKTYDDSPSNGAKLITNKDEQADATILSSGDCGSSFSADATVSPGSSQQGCIPFEIKKKSKPKVFQFGLDSGFGPETGEWSVR